MFAAPSQGDLARARETGMLKRIGKYALWALGAFLVFFLLVVVYNLSWFESPHGDGRIKLIAHRGVHQTFSKDGVENDTCTADRIYPPAHDLIENTLPSMDAAFAAGADVVELDVHLTPDKQFAVMHDWTVDCRTQGKGATEQLDIAYLKTLDLGYGYTADGGKTYPLRGKGVGMMPTLPEVLTRFPDKRFLINFKSKRAEEGEALGALVQQHPEWRSALWAAYGGAEPTLKSMEVIKGLGGYTNKSVVSCAIAYETTGWTGIVPKECRNTMVYVPANYAWMVWGWPHKFTKRMASVGSTVILIGPVDSDEIGTSGIDSIEQLNSIPEKFEGYVWTNRIELIGPELARRGQH
jgi:glycerophosphoryl diester phosphodiesterase